MFVELIVLPGFLSIELNFLSLRCVSSDYSERERREKRVTQMLITAIEVKRVNDGQEPVRAGERCSRKLGPTLSLSISLSF